MPEMGRPRHILRAHATSGYPVKLTVKADRRASHPREDNKHFKPPRGFASSRPTHCLTF
jgi:hypothetical protein